ncbi:MAG TPA: AI-2E family transporter [Propionicimonas sp.]|nr:AI-2E family transporter [Propionicimonas sp.]HRA06818.1 AI-2E family transporter [Propionicimonas sp.]
MSETPTPGTSRELGGAAVVVGGMVLALAGIQATAGIVGPAFLVVTLVITVQPLRGWLERHRVPGWASGIAALLAVYGLLLAILGSLAWSLAQLATILPTYSAAFSKLWAGIVTQLESLGITASAVSKWLGSVDLSGLAAGFGAILGSLTSGLSTFALLLMLVFFLTLDADGFGRRLEFIARFRPRITEGLVAFGQRVRRYWLVTSAFGLIVAVLDTIGLALLSVPLAVTWGVLAFITNYIPNVGFFIGLLPPVLIALVDEGPGTALAVVMVYGVINLVVQTIIQPRVTGDAVGLAPSVALLSLLLWAVILGPLGALLAIPATLLLKSLLVDHNPNARWLAGLLDAGAAFPAIGPTHAGHPDQPRADQAKTITP